MEMYSVTMIFSISDTHHGPNLIPFWGIDMEINWIGKATRVGASDLDWLVTGLIWKQSYNQSELEAFEH